ncbi:hypothetical protein RND71_032638 [Anisodus tanguticus]|uniref:Proteasome assembly chaperone 3 n=1 Tax=Anisodus tanguticus TaxID=243964 RepID=A0AAE1V2F7_9SOLA|nr:hypothetical protein RND71_032638 [Anisodus tanguticus]
MGNKTDIVICAYDDHFLVIATQIGSMGTILHARKEEGVSIHPTFSVSVLLGKRDEPMLVACARQIIEHISNAGSFRSLVLSLGLRDHSLPTLKGIVSAVTENCLCVLIERGALRLKDFREAFSCAAENPWPVKSS